ncbi:MAG: fabD, partial [Gammaproteobacteria bacterium]|nr:fabD [Gammaproteobacteria bacterium]
DMWQLVQEGPEQRLNQTEFTQPALLTASVAVWRVWNQLQGQRPTLLAGHSLGEYTALVCAEAMAFTDAVKLVAERGRLMQLAVPENVGAMAAIIGLENEQVDEVCRLAMHDQVVTPANFNAHGQVVIAGNKEAVERAIGLAKQAGAKLAKLIPVSVPSHCPLMREAAQQLADTLKNITIASPKIPVLNNVDVRINTDSLAIKEALVQQLASPVQWVKTIEYMAAQGVQMIMECGPGKVLSGLNKRITAGLPTLALNNPTLIEEALAAL